MKRLYGIFFGLSALLINFLHASEVSTGVLSRIQVAEIHEAYAEYGNNFINHLPASISYEQCRQELLAEQSSVQALLDSFSYKSVFASRYGLLKTGMLMASLVGMWTVGNVLNMNTLAYNVANDFANALFRDSADGHGEVLLINGKPRLHPSVEGMAFDRAAEKGYDVSVGDINKQWPDEVWREFVPNLPEAKRNYQVIQHAPVDRIEKLQNFPAAGQALTAVAAISGFGLYKDIQEMRARKAQLTEYLQKVNNMLAVLGRA